MWKNRKHALIKFKKCLTSFEMYTVYLSSIMYIYTSKKKWKYFLSNSMFCFVLFVQTSCVWHYYQSETMFSVCVVVPVDLNEVFFVVFVCAFRVWACSLIWWSTARGTDTVWWSCRWREVKSGTPCVCLTKMSCRLRDLSAPSLLWWRYINTQTQRKTTAAWLHFTLEENRT